MTERNGRVKVTIYLDGGPKTYIARAYDDETEEHIWSSERASSVAQALREVADGIERRAR